MTAAGLKTEPGWDQGDAERGASHRRDLPGRTISGRPTKRQRSGTKESRPLAEFEMAAQGVSRDRRHHLKRSPGEASPERGQVAGEPWWAGVRRQARVRPAGHQSPAQPLRPDQHEPAEGEDYHPRKDPSACHANHPCAPTRSAGPERGQGEREAGEAARRDSRRQHRQRRRRHVPRGSRATRSGARLPQEAPKAKDPPLRREGLHHELGRTLVLLEDRR